MFMVIYRNGEIRTTQVTLPPITKSRRSSQHRSRGQWIAKMATLAPQHKCRFFAFRYMGKWLCVDIMEGGNAPMVELPGDARMGAEMWVMHKEEAHR